MIGYEGLYEVSSLGRVRSLDRVNLSVTGARRTFPGVVLAPAKVSTGYLGVSLHVGGKKKTRTVHTLVCEAFHGERPQGMLACHDNGNELDNRSSNLKWGTYSDNAYDRSRHGRHEKSNRVSCPRNHALASPNLVASVARRGFRECLACNRAGAYIRMCRRKGLKIPELQALSDEYFWSLTIREENENG